MPLTPTKIDTALRHMKKADPVMHNIIRRVGPFTLRPHRDRFALLVRSIISQQISTKAAQSIRLRVQQSVPNQKLTPENITTLNLNQLRAAGLSQQKATYLVDLCEHALDGRLQLSKIGRLSDEAVIEQLIQVKGIGRWTAQMFLIFALGRLDVFPHDDLGVRAALKRLYRLDDLPDKQTSHRIAEPWRPYATIGTWYCWRSGDLPQTEQADWSSYPV